MDSWIRNQEEVFGRGLNLGQQRERERIIKLLEERYLKLDANSKVLNTENNKDLLYVIELIKGEK